MWSPFRKNHLENLLEISLKNRNSLDFYTHSYFRENRSLGSKDRLWVKKGLYEIFKWKELLNAYKAVYADELVDLYTSEECPIEKDQSHLPSNVQVSFPKWLFKKIVDSMGYEAAVKFCRTSNEIAPITIRVNTLKTPSKEFYEKHKDEFQLTKCKKAEHGFHLKKNLQFHTIEAFKLGHFEPQDEASQLISNFVKAKPGEHILDYCAASGGKTLAFAPDMNKRGQVHLHDIRKKPLIDAKKRLKRAGIETFQIYHENEKRMNALKGNMHSVLVDAPCSCSGTFRRRPDHKWLLTEESLADVIKTQCSILAQASKYVKKGGQLIYATCSVLKEENEEQIEHFLARNDFSLVSQSTIELESGGSDAMFVAVLKNNSLV